MTGSSHHKKSSHVLRMIKRKIPRNKVYSLKQRDFKYGTYRITKPGRYILKENITFSPNSKNNFRPNPEHKLYSSKAYSLGFFAAITIEVDGVEIDLNGKTLKQGDDMAWMQRFYSNIETSSAPFIPNQGPGDFGSKVVSPKYIYIHNGILGRSSHHAIHGNSNEYVCVEKVRMVDYEFIGLALNGSNHVIIKHCDVRNNFRNVKVLASWSTALFLHQFMEDAEHNILNNHLEYVSTKTFNNFKKALDNLTSTIEETKSNLMKGKKVKNPLFHNPSLIGDGNMYGILTHPKGLAVNDFTSSKTKNIAKNWWIEDCKVRNIKGNVDEVITFQDPQGNVQKGPAGDVLKLLDCTNKDGTYKSNPISEGIINLMLLKRLIPSVHIGTLTIHTDIVLWSQNKLTFQQLQKRGFRYSTTQDSMAHHNKGVLGIRLDGTKGIHISNLKIHNIQNIGRSGIVLDKVKNGANKKYLGCLCSGLHMSYAFDCSVQECQIKDIISQNGQSCGIQMINQSVIKDIQNTMIDNIQSGINHNGQWDVIQHNGTQEKYIPNKVNPSCASFGVYMTDKSNIEHGDVDISTLTGPKTEYIHNFENS